MVLRGENIPRMKTISYSVRTESVLLFWLFKISYLLHLVNSASVTVSILPNGSGIKGSTVHIGCPITEYPSAKTVTVYKMTAVDALPGSDLIYCTSTSNCFTLRTLPSRYSYNRNITGVYLTISNVQHEDAGWWRCYLDEGDVSSNVEKLVVYTLSSAVEYISQPASSADLGSSNVTITCQTSECCNPAPTFTWYYMDGTTRQLYISSVTGVIVSNSGCTSPENKYSRTLTLPQYSTFIGNLPKTTRFQCGMTRPVLSDELFTDSSVEITFAVRVTSVVLKDGDTTISTETDIQVEIGTSKSLSVEWFPANSKPGPTVTCYIDSTPTTLTGSVFTFNVREQDHQKNIYCTAVNSNASPVNTVTAKLFVVVPLTGITLTYNGHTLGTGTEIRVNDRASKELRIAFTPTNPRPVPTVGCFVGTTSVQNDVQGSVFSFTAHNEDHNKDVYCKTSGTNVIETKKAKLYVIVGVTTLSITNSSLVLLNGRTSTATCVTTTSTRPAANVTWEINGSTLLHTVDDVSTTNTGMFSVTSTVTLTAVKTYDGQSLVCKARVGPQAFVSTAQEITVWYAPSKPTVQAENGSPFPWLEGRSRSLQCSTPDRGKPKSSVVWSDNIRGQVSGEKLQFQTLTSDDNTMAVHCQLRNNVTEVTGETAISDTITLNVEFKPQIQLTSEGEDPGRSLTTKEGTDVSLQCQASGNPTPTSIVWQPRNTAVLRFQDIDRTNTGNYTCTASAVSTRHGTLFSSKQLQVIVQYAPDISVTLTNNPLVEGQQVTVVCNPQGLPDTYNYLRFEHTWQGRHLRNLTGQRTFVITSAKLQDSGTYTCFADNTIPDRNNTIEQQGSATVQITGIPTIGKSDALIFSGEPGNSTTITIPFYSNPSIKSLRFIRGMEPLHNSSRILIYHNATRVTATLYNVEVELDGYSAVLILRNLTENDFGNYTIQLENDIGTMNKTLEVVASSEPLEAVNFVTLTSTSDGRIHVLWNPGFNGGHKQNFTIQYRRDGEGSWTTALEVEENDPRYRLSNGSYSANITGLTSGSYALRLVSSNRKGHTEGTEITSVRVPDVPKHPEKSLPLAGILGGIGAGVVIIVAVVLLLVMRSRRLKGTKSDNIQLKRSKEDEDEDVIVINDIYGRQPVRGAEIQHPSSSSANDENYTYAEVTKTRKPELYAQVVKPKKTNGKFQVGKGSPKKTAGEVPETVYENPGGPNNNPAANAESVYENHEQGVIKTPKQKRNEDELPYAQIEFAKQRGGKKKIIIHGIDDKTEYAEVAFGQVGEKAPESDEDVSTKTDTK